MKNTAVRPNFMPNIAINAIIKDKGVTDEERYLHTLSSSAGWRILNKYILEQIDGLEQLNVLAMANGAPLEEIGRNTVVANLAKDIIKRVLNKVADAKEACEAPDGTIK